MIPDFDKNGNLIPGIHLALWDDFVKRFGTSTERRRKLITGLEDALKALKNAGCKKVFIDGSFVTTKPEPGDYDACWDLTDVNPVLLDPVFLIFDNGRAAQKVKYFGEFFPGDVPEGVTGKTFLEFFQTDKRTGEPKGIIAIDLGGV